MKKNLSFLLIQLGAIHIGNGWSADAVNES